MARPANRVIHRVLLAPEGRRGLVLLALAGFTKMTPRTPTALIALAEQRLADWRARGTTTEESRNLDFVRVNNYSDSAMVDDTRSPAPKHMTVAQAGARLSLSDKTVRQLITTGELPAERIGPVWMIPIDAIDGRLSRGSRNGRRLTASNAWAVLFMAVGMPAPWLDRHDRWRLGRYLATHRLSEMRTQMIDRGSPRSYRAHSSMLAQVRSDPALMLTGPAAASEMRLGLVGGSGDVEAYVAEQDLDSLVRHHHLQSSREPNVTLRIVPSFGLSWPPARVAPVSAIAFDLLDNPEPRAQQVGEGVLRDLDRANTHQDHPDR